MFTYTIEEVKTFLGSKSNTAASLRKSLERKGFTVSVKKGQFILDKELTKPDNMADILGFKPSRPNTTFYIIKVLLEGEFKGSYRELAEYIQAKYEVEFTEDSVGRAYRELVKHGLAMSSTDAKDHSMRELRVNGEVLTDEDRLAFFKDLEEAKNTLKALGLSDLDAHQMAWKAAVNKNGQLYSVPFKLLNFTPTHVEWFKRQ